MDRVFSGASFTIIQYNSGSNLIDSIFLWEYSDSRIITINTIPFIRNIASPTISIGIQDDRLASAIDFRNGNLNVSTEATHFERSRFKLTTIGRLHCYRVNARFIDLFRGVCAESSFTGPSILIGTSRNNDCNEGGIIVCAIAVLTKNSSTSDRDIINSSVNRVNHAVAQSRSTTKAVGFNFDNVLTRIGQRNKQGVETGTSRNHSTIYIPFIECIRLSVGHINLCNAIGANIGAANSSNRRSCRSRNNQNMDRICSGTGLVTTHIHSGSNLIPSVSSRINSNGGAVLTTCPLIGNCTCPTINISTEGDGLTSASIFST